jgi:formylglycine-generating enzyme required for sulfatase activity
MRTSGLVVACLLAITSAVVLLLTLLASDLAQAHTTKPKPLPDKLHSAEEVKAAQKAWAEYLKMPVELTEDLGGGVKLEMVLIPPGTFWMGSPASEDGRDSDEVLHRVTLTKAFYLGKYEVTQQQYQRVTGNNPSEFSATGLFRLQVRGKDPSQFPVDSVSWDDAVAFCKKLNDKLSTSGKAYRLPTEAQWEYACRGGACEKDSKPFHFDAGPASSITADRANLFESKLTRTERVGTYKPNRFGLYDMHGNVCEWCADAYGDYATGEVRDPEAVVGQFRVIRGGNYCTQSDWCRAANRARREPARSYDDLGFRIARAAPAHGE